jgi:ribosomal protein S18 acetylase RimI-like enzyme
VPVSVHAHPSGAPLPGSVPELLRTVFVGEGYSAPALAERAFSPEVLRTRGDFFLALNGEGELLGTTCLVEPNTAFVQVAVDGELEVHLVAVRPERRGQGVARALVTFVIGEGRRRGTGRLVLSTQTRMTAAQALYESVGFRRNAARDWTRPSGPNFLVYELELAERRG